MCHFLSQHPTLSSPQTVVATPSSQRNDANTEQNADNDGFILSQNRKRKAAEVVTQPRPRGRPAKGIPRTEELPRRGPIEAWAVDSQAINVPATQSNIDASQ